MSHTNPTEPIDPTVRISTSEPTEHISTGSPANPLTTAPKAPTPPAGPTYKTGPTIWPIVVGITGLLTILISWSVVQTALTINWGIAAPAVVVALGALIIAAGLLGLRRPSAETPGE